MSPVKAKSSGSKSKILSSSVAETISTSAPDLVNSDNRHPLSLPTVSVSVSRSDEQLPSISQASVPNPSRSLPATSAHSSTTYLHSSSGDLSSARGALQFPSRPPNSHPLSDLALRDTMHVRHRPMTVHHPAAYDGSGASSSQGILTLLASEEKRDLFVYYITTCG